MGGLVAVTAAAALVLTACGSDDNSGSGSTSSATSQTDSGTTGGDAGASSPATAGGADASASDSGAAGASGSADSSAAGGAAGSSDAGSSAAGGAGSSAAGGADSSGAGSSAAPGGAAASFDAAGFTCESSAALRSSGSTAQGKAIGAWIDAYNTKCGSKINPYGGGGSGKGVSDFIANQTDFGGSDSALKEDEMAEAKTKRCQGNDAIDLPMVTGPIAVAFNVDGVDKLTLTPAVLSGIFGGEIKKWNDPKIAEVNSGVNLPDALIKTVHRSEDSGTTDNFTKYLAAAGKWDFEGGQGLDRSRRPGRPGLRRCAEGIGLHCQLHRLRRVGLRHRRQPEDGRHRQRRRAGRADR
nr:substrate-binding domain-containing protein [Nakamurella aerolata]